MSEDYNPLAPTGENFNYKQMEVGSVIQGVISATPKMYPHTDFKTKEQMKSAKGHPLWKVGVTFDTPDGTKKVYLEKGAYFEFINAVKGLGIRNFEATEGLAFGLKRSADEPSQTAGFAPRKVFEVVLKKI